MCRALVQKQDLRPSIKCSGEQHSLFLSARQRAAHVPDKAVIGHWHCHNLLVDPRQLRTLDHPILIKGWIEKADVIGNGAGEELVLLHYCSDVLAIGPG